MTMNPLFLIPDAVLHGNVLILLTFKEAVLLGSALSRQSRADFHRKLRSYSFTCTQPVNINVESCKWLGDRGVSAQHAVIMRDVTFSDEHIASFGDLLLNVRILNFAQNRVIPAPRICSILQHCPNLVEVAFGRHEDDVNVFIEPLSRLAHLKKLSISSCTTFAKQASLELLQQRFPDLTDLHLPDDSCARDRLPVSYANLQVLSFGGRDIKVSMFESLCVNCPQLHSLSVTCNGLELINDQHVAVLVRHRKNMRSLKLGADFSNCLDVSDATMVPLAALSTNLECFRLGSMLITDCTIDAFAAHCPQLRKLEIRHCCKISCEAMVNLARCCHNMQNLDLSYCAGVEDHLIFQLVESCPYLKQLHINSGEVTDASIIALAAAFPRLQSLDLSGCECLTDAAVLQVCQNCCGLRGFYLDFMGDSVTDASVAAMAQYLRHLEVFGAESDNITTEALREVSKANPRALWM